MRRAAERRGALSRFADVQGLRMHWLEVPGRGDGPTVVLVHGLGGSALGWWRVMFRLAGHVRRVVAVDLPGAGFSPIPATGPLGFSGVMSALESFAHDQVSEPAVYLGNSLGAAMVARFASRHPDQTSGAVLVSPAGGRVSAERIEELVAGFQVTTQREARELARRFFSRPLKVLPLLMGPSLLKLMRGPGVRRLLDEALRTSGLEAAELEGLEPPVLLLWAKNERVLPYESLDHFRKHLPPTAQIEEVEDFGHSPQLDRPQRLVARVVRFLAERVKGNLAA
jgi:pimeloyl-ACP methyl ester carboxylesterase